MTDKPYSEMTDAELAAVEIEWLGNLADASGPSSAFFASRQCDLILAEIERREMAAIEAKVHASTVAARETRDKFRGVLSKAATRYDPVSFEAGERSMRERAANEAERFKAFADKKFDDALDNARRGQRNLELAMAAAAGMAHQARRVAATIRELPTGENP